MKAAGYVRVSTSGQTGDAKLSLQVQRESIQQYCADNNLQLLPIYDEGAQSGADLDRPELQRLLADAPERKFQSVVVADLSRFGRDNIDALVNIRELKRLGIEFISIKEQFMPGPVGDMLRSIISGVNELERATIKLRTHGARNRLWKAKRRWIGLLPFGYTFDEKTEKVVQIKEEADVMRRIVTEYLDLNLSFNDICIRLNKDHVTTRRGRKWNTANLSAYLRQTIYYGYAITNRYIMNAKGEVAGEKPEDEWIIWDCDDIDAILTKARWDKVQAKAATGLSRSGRPSKFADTFLLHGLLKCGVCGATMVPYRADEKSHGGKRYYQCRWHKSGVKEREIAGRERCHLPTIPAEMLEDWIWDQLMVKFGREREKHFAPLLEDTRFDEQIAAQEAKIVSITKSAAQAERAARKLFLAFTTPDPETPEEDDPDDARMFKIEHRKLTQEAKHLRQELKSAQKYLVELTGMKADQQKFAELVGNEALLSSIWLKMDELPLRGKQQLLKGLLDGAVEVYPPTWLSVEEIKKMNARNHKGPLVDAVKSKPKFRFNEAILQKVLGVNKHLEKC